MSLQSWQETLVAQQAAGTSFGTFTTAKSVINTQALYTLPPGFWVIGKTLRITAAGGIGTVVTTPGTIVFQVMIGGVIAFTTGTMQLNATAHTNLPFWLQIMLTCRAVGSGTAANAMGQAVAFGKQLTVTAAQVDGVNSNTILMAPATAPAVGTGFDSTIATILDFWCGFSISDAANTIKIEQYIVESLN
jgi:hypothetical protein